MCVFSPLVQWTDVACMFGGTCTANIKVVTNIFTMVPPSTNDDWATYDLESLEDTEGLQAREGAHRLSIEEVRRLFFC